MILSDESPMPFGKHKGEKMANVPASYLIWLYENDKCSMDVRDYIEDNLEVLKQEIGNDENDSINHPKHYASHPSGIECIQITEHYNFNVGNAIKYVWRAGIKSEEGKSDLEKQIEDLGKAKWYLEREIQRLEKQLSNESNT